MNISTHESLADLREANDLMLDDCLLLANLREVLAEKIGTRIAECKVEGDTYPQRVSRAMDVILAELDALNNPPFKARARK